MKSVLKAAPPFSASLRVVILGLAVSLAACTTHGPYHEGPGPVIGPAPGSVPGTTKAPGKPAAIPTQTAPSPSYAPPPGGNSHWDASLGVHVIDTAPNTYYRQRTYYRWDNGWTWSSSLNGPWQATDSTGVPAGLGRKFAAP